MSTKNICFKFDMLILSILLHGDFYGYQITSAIKNLSDGVIDIKEGSLYPHLYKMLDKGYITSKEEIVNHKARVYYHIEDSGKKYLEDMVREYKIWERKIKYILDFKGEIKDE